MSFLLLRRATNKFEKNLINIKYHLNLISFTFFTDVEYKTDHYNSFEVSINNEQYVIEHIHEGKIKLRCETNNQLDTIIVVDDLEIQSLIDLAKYLSKYNTINKLSYKK